MGKVKITPELAARFDTLARELPPICKTDKDGNPITKIVTVSGQKILDDGYTPKTKGEPPINPKMIYKTPVLVFFNHRQELESAYIRSGYNGVETYCTFIKALRTDLDEKARLAAPKIGFFQKLLNKFKK